MNRIRWLVHKFIHLMGTEENEIKLSDEGWAVGMVWKCKVCGKET